MTRNVFVIFQDLGKTVDFLRSKVYLVAYVVRIGAMEYKDVESKRDNAPFSGKAAPTQVRRPYGVAAKDITNLFKENAPSLNDNEPHTVFYMP